MTEPTQASSHLRKSLWRNDQAILTIAAMAIGLCERFVIFMLEASHGGGVDWFKRPAA